MPGCWCVWVRRTCGWLAGGAGWWWRGLAGAVGGCGGCLGAPHCPPCACWMCGPEAGVPPCRLCPSLPRNKQTLAHQRRRPSPNPTSLLPTLSCRAACTLPPSSSELPWALRLACWPTLWATPSACRCRRRRRMPSSVSCRAVAALWLRWAAQAPRLACGCGVAVEAQARGPCFKAPC